MSRCAHAAAAGLVAALLLSACGGGGGPVAFTKGGPPAPRKCIERWNAEEGALLFGKHAYSPGHDSRAARVFFVNDPERDLPNVCTYVFAVSDSDREFGSVGGFGGKRPGDDRFTWQYISHYPVKSPKERIALQRSGAEQANVSLHENGKMTPLH